MIQYIRTFKILSFKSFKKLFERNNLKIFHVKKIPTHGGSQEYVSKKKVYKGKIG